MDTITPDSTFSLLYAHVPKSREGRENFLTDCLALALADDQLFARSFVELLVGGRCLDRLSLDEAEIRVKTQDGSTYQHCCLDLVLDVARPGSGTVKRVVVECKLGAPLSPQQHAKYMKLPVWGVAVLSKKRIARREPQPGWRARWLPLAGNASLQWGDVHKLAADAVAGGNASPLVGALVGLLKKLKLDPPHPEVGQFGRGGTPKEQEQRRAFFANWSATLPLLAAAGWPNCSPGKQAQVYSGEREGPRNGRRISDLLLNPLADGGRTLRVRLNGYSDSALADAEKDLKKARLPHNGRVTSEIRTVKRLYGAAQVLDVDVPMSVVLPVGASAEERATALAHFVRAVIKKAG